MAKRFTFKLDPVLRHRKRAEDERLRSFAKAQASALAQQTHLDDLAAQKANHEQEVVKLFAEHADFNSIIDYQRYLNSLSILAAYGRRELSKCEKVLDEERGLLLEARTKRRALEILRERREEEYRKENEREEGQQTDEMGIQRLRSKASLWKVEE